MLGTTDMVTLKIIKSRLSIKKETNYDDCRRLHRGETYKEKDAFNGLNSSLILIKNSSSVADFTTALKKGPQFFSLYHNCQ